MHDFWGLTYWEYTCIMDGWCRANKTGPFAEGAWSAVDLKWSVDEQAKHPKTIPAPRLERPKLPDPGQPTRLDLRPK